jgi:isopentenyl-diphosphate delta-isomerase
MLVTYSKIHGGLILRMPSSKRWFSNGTVHASQLSAMKDMLIHVDESDRVLGSLPKLESHLAKSITAGITHRAFSVFLFDSIDKSMLIQKRARTKIVFPREWANTCCSHPLHNEEEMDTRNNQGVKRAASKRLGAELGLSTLQPESLIFKDKILYRQLSPGGVFGESEVDYILFATAPRDTTLISPNSDEVEEIQWITPGGPGDRTGNLKRFLSSETLRGFPPTPWFNLMVHDANCLERWWGDLIDKPDLFMSTEHDGSIRRFV